MITDLLQHSINGLLDGGSYALVGLGLSLTFGSLRRLNLAYGAGAMLAAYVGSWLYVTHDAPVWVVALAVVGSATLIGSYVEQLCFAHTHDDAVTTRGGGPLAGADRGEEPT